MKFTFIVIKKLICCLALFLLLSNTTAQGMLTFEPHSPGKPSERGPLTPQQAAENHREKEIEASFGEWDPMMASKTSPRPLEWFYGHISNA